MSKNGYSNIAYEDAVRHYKNNNLFVARTLFEKLLGIPRYRKYALLYLFQIEIKDGNIKRAREIVNKLKSMGIPNGLNIATLEQIEYNFDKSKKFLNECLFKPSISKVASLYLAKIYIQLGDYDTGRELLKRLQENYDFYVQATFSLISLSILQEDFEESERLLRNLDTSRMTPKVLSHYRKTENIIKYLKGQIDKIPNSKREESNYILNLFQDESDETLLAHIKRHEIKRRNAPPILFQENLDYEKLLSDISEQISSMNGNHFEVSDMYRFKLDYPVGITPTGTTKDICVATVIGTKKIITAYPILLSSEFDREGLSTSKTLQMKRQNNVKKQ